MPWFEGLEEGNPAFEIVACENPHVRVVAGPGAGKSFAMKRRVARLLESEINPRFILPVTFTRVAADNLHRELVNMDVEGAGGLQGTTLHSLALRTLMRRHVLDATGRTPRPLNDFERKPLEADLKLKYGGLREIRKKIKAYEAAWARLQRDDPGFAQTDDEIAFETSLVEWLRFHRSMLIGEVIPLFHDYLLSNPMAAERREYSHILVDEYQDLNKAEQSTIELLADEADVCIVGDDDQSIYSFKHAHPEGIREWVEINPEAEDLSLEECRRCPTRVVSMANSLIAHNRRRPVPHELTPRAENGEGDVRIVQYLTLEQEIEGVSRMISEMIEAGTSPGDILVLAQRSVIGTPIFENLTARWIQVRSYYAESELDAEEAQRRFALLKLFVDRDDRVALRWLLGLGSKDWRARAYQRIRERAAAENSSPWEILRNVANGADHIPYVKPLINRFEELRSALDDLEKCPDLETVIDFLFPEDCDATGELRELSLNALDEVDGDDRVQFLSELMSAIATPEVPSEIEDIRIMSLHKSKGLSAPITIVAGCVEGLLPMRPDSNRSDEEQAEYMEEQRRLFYVGISRVKAIPENNQPGTLILTYSGQMRLATAMGAGISPAESRYGTATLNASRFIRELGPSAPRPIVG